MQVRTFILKAFIFIACLCSISFFVSCRENLIMDDSHDGLGGEGISFGVSKDINSWNSDSRTLQQADTLVLSCISDDKTFGVNMVIGEKTNSYFSSKGRGTQFTKDDILRQFDVAAYYYGDNETTADLFFVDQVNDGVHTSSDTYYWPHEGKLDFMAFAPQYVFNMPTADVYNNDVMSFDHIVTADEQYHQDIMVATVRGVNHKETGYAVPLTFRHLLASVRFVVGNMQFIEIESIIVRGVLAGEMAFTYDKQNGSWTNSTPTTITSFVPDIVETSGLQKGSEIVGNINNATLFMAPQTLPDNAEIEVNYTALLTGERGSGIAKIGGQEWEAGKDYAYALNIGTKFDVTIPTPNDQDAHYIMLKMYYELGALSDYVTSIKAEADFLDDGSNTSTKSGISLLFEEDLSETQKYGFWTDSRYVKTITINSEGESSSTTQGPENIRGTGELLIGNKLSGTIVLFIEENNGTTDRNGELVFTATLGDGSEIIIGQGDFKQLCPSWNDEDLGVERIESSNSTYPYGFDYNRKVVYTNPGNEWWLFKNIGRILYSWGASSFITDDEGDFITLDYETWWIFSYINKVTLNYGALNELDGIATHADGLVNTLALYNFTGSSDFSTIETNLDENLRWTKNESDDEDIPEDYAAFIALARNRMYEMKTVVTGSGTTETTYKPFLYEDSNGKEIIEWYLPSSDEAESLKETGEGSSVVSPLNGNYWSSTAGDDMNAYAHSYTYSNNVFGSVNESKPRMDKCKVRAVRKKL